MISKIERTIAFRYLKPKKKEGFLKVISIFSFTGIALGVAILIIVMSVMNGFRTELINKILGFNSGCDDYLVKPFDLPELECRIFALNKRGQYINVNKIIFGELILYPLERKVYRNDDQIFLNKNQFNILMELIKQHPRAVTREKLIELIWEDDVPDTDSLRSHIYRLRNLIDKPYLFSMIETPILDPCEHGFKTKGVFKRSATSSN